MEHYFPVPTSQANPTAAVACFTTLCLQALQLKVSLRSHRNSHISHFINPPLSRCLDVDLWILLFLRVEQSLSPINDSLLGCEPCVGTGKMSLQMVVFFQIPQFTSLPVDSFNHHKNKKIRRSGLKRVEENRLCALILSTHLIAFELHIIKPCLELNYFSSSLSGFPCRKSAFFYAWN